MASGRIRVGCSGWNYASWRNTFYPPRTPASRWLEHYATVFDTVEVNSTFYRLAKRDAVARWVEQTPPDFCFSVKASRYLTHIRRLTDVEQGIENFYAPLMPLVDAGKLGPVLWQLPPNFQRDDAKLGALLNALADHPPSRHCVEFRHPSWFHEDVYEMLRWHGAALVIGDRKGLEFQTQEITADWTFVRFHYGHRGRRGNYSPAEIAEWAQRLRAWSRRAQVWAFYNNDWEVFAPRNGVTLQRLLAN
jgi:uncharacterized protein YecE (DUF72 family)